MCSPNVLVNMCFSKCVSQHVHLLCARLFTSMLNSMLFCVGSNRTTVSVYQFVREVQKLFDVNGVGSDMSFHNACLVWAKGYVSILVNFLMILLVLLIINLILRVLGCKVLALVEYLLDLMGDLNVSEAQACVWNDRTKPLLTF